MPAGPRVRANNVYGTVSDNPLLVGAVSFTSLGLSLLPPISGQHAVAVLDPKRVFGEPEIVVITSHLAMGTTATITRGQYGTVAREHPQGTAWAHVPVDEDWIEILTSGTRPGNPYEGQFIFETDTNKLVGYGGVDWAPRDAGGQIGYDQSIVSVVTSGTTELTLFTVAATVGTGRSIRVMHFEANNVGTVSADIYEFRLKEDGVLKQTTTYQVGVSNIQSRTNITTIILSPTAGSRTYTVTLQRISGTGTLTVTRSAAVVGFLAIEDLGAA